MKVRDVLKRLEADGWYHTKSVEYRLVIRRGTHARGKRQREINNQFLITRFSIRSECAGAIVSLPMKQSQESWLFLASLGTTYLNFPRITGLPPYINTKKSTKPSLHGASQKKLTRRYCVHFPLENGCTVDCIWSRAIP